MDANQRTITSTHLLFLIHLNFAPIPPTFALSLAKYRFLLMQAFIRFLLQNNRLLFFGLLLTFFSSFGQTFLVSLYVPEIGAAFSLTNTQLSSLYAAATLGSAFTLPWVGRYVDVWSLRRFTLGVLTGLLFALLLLSAAPHPAVVLLGFYGLRLFGQGLMSHTSISTMARAFEANRGKAIGIATVGHSLGEAILPLLMAFLIGATGWRSGLQFSALALAVLVIPLIWGLQRTFDRRVTHPHLEVASASGDPRKNIRNPLRLLRTRAFWVIVPAVFLLGFLNTAILFFQVQLGASKGWEASWVAGSLAAFAGGSALSMLAAGPLVDRLTARQVFPFFLLPYVGGLCLLASFDFRLIYPAALFLLGLSNGSGSTIKNALLAEIYGTASIGAVRSFFATVMVFSTALGPITFGLLLDVGLGFEPILLACAALVGMGAVWSLRIWSPFTRARWAVRWR